MPQTTVEESYGATNPKQPTSFLAPLLGKTQTNNGTATTPNGVNDVNVGLANSARGEGTTTAEIVAKFRFLNVCTCGFVILFHVLPIVLNPIRLTLLATSPIRLILELLVALLALSLLLVESRIPFLGEKALLFVRGGELLGGRKLLDLDLANGRVAALMIMGSAVTLINYLTISSKNVGRNGTGGIPKDTTPVDDPSGYDDNSNSTNADESNIASNSETDGSSSNSHFTTLSIILQCTIFSPTIWVLVLLALYTLFILQKCPEYSRWRAYPHLDPEATNPGGDGAMTSSTAINVGYRDADARVSGDVSHGNGYQTLTPPTWAKPSNSG